MRLSVVISAYNEEKMIRDCLLSVKNFADEIIFVDNTSQDRTVEIAKEFTKNIFTLPNNPVVLNKNKNYGFSKAKGDWIISLDADERITPQLQKETINIIKSGSEFSAFQIPRKNIIFGKWISHAGWYPDYQIRLFRNGKAKFPEKNVHEMLEVNGSIGTLKNDLEHQNYQTIYQFVNKLNNYTDSEAELLIGEKYEITWRDSMRFPLKEFLKRFFAQEGYKDGIHGLVLSLLMAFYWEIVFAKVWERKEKFKDMSPENFPKQVTKELGYNAKQIKYWIYTILIKEEPKKRLVNKIKRKLF